MVERVLNQKQRERQISEIVGTEKSKRNKQKKKREIEGTQS